MSKMSKAVAKQQEVNSLRLDETVTNFMGGDSYIINPLDTLKMITASSIFGEPSYYRDSNSSKRYLYKINPVLSEFDIMFKEYENKTTNQIFEDAIDKALDYDFGGTLEWAVELRKNYMMRLNPQVIMVRASIHPKREEWTKEHPGLFNEINQKVMQRADEPMTQMTYYMYQNGGKKNDIPSIIKRSWAKNLSSLNRYKVAKYKNHECGMINAVRISHAHSKVLDELMTTGTVEVTENQKTWENLRSQGKSWKEILETCDLGHMALLRNLRGIFTEIDDLELCQMYMKKLKDGVIEGKQFPFRYWSALKVIEKSDCNHKAVIMDALEECMDIAIENFPKLKGKTICLSDNSGSAWGSFNSEYGSVTVAEIDNLSSVITAMCSDEGYVGKFGDKLIITPITKRNGVLSQTKSITNKGYRDVGGNTEGGIWKFFRDAIRNGQQWDNIFIYSDQQAGHGGLYGTEYDIKEYRSNYMVKGDFETMINVFKLIEEYRKKVNPKVNVFSIQTAGYDNVVIPEYAYRTNIMYGWTGREAVFADTIIKQWDEIDTKNN